MSSKSASSSSVPRRPSAAPPPRTGLRASGFVPLLLLAAVALATSGCGGSQEKDDAPVARAGPVSRTTVLVEPARLDPAAVARHVESFDYVWRTIRDKHWDPELGGLDWDAMREKYRPRVQAAGSDDEALGAINQLIAELGQSHFAVFPEDVTAVIEGEDAEEHDHPTHGGGASGAGGTGTAVHDHGDPGVATSDPPTRPDRNREGHGDVGFDLRVVDGRAVVTRVDTPSPASRTGIRPGWIVESVDGRPLQPIIDRFHSSGEHGGELEIMLQYSLEGRMKGDPGEEVALVLLDGNDDPRPIKLTLDPPDGTIAKLGHMPAMVVEWDGQVLEEDVAYFRLGAFFDPVAVMPDVRNFITGHLDAKGFIFDLRGNPGGLGIMSNGISGMFVQEGGLKLGTMLMREGEIFFSIFPQAVTYTGPLAILIDGGSASTSEIMAGGLRDLGRARLFGVRTAGAALPSVFERLPNGAGFQYAIANYISVGGDVLEGDGVAPDVEVPLDRATLLRGEDPVIDAALRWIRSAN